jgi:peptide/nickel transport system substrate-binding protein
MHQRIRLIAIITMISLLAWGASWALAAEPKRGGTLRIAYGNKISHFDFHTAPGYELIWVAMNIGCGLVNVTPDGKFVGDAAESWNVSPDGRTYTFKLRDNVYFHDNTQVDAAAVKFSIDRLMDPATKSGMRRFYEPVDRVEVVDPRTVRVHMKRPYAFFLHMIAGYRTGLVLYSPAATKKYDLADRKKGKPGAVVGCGPFKFVEWVPNDHFVMDRWEKYHRAGMPYVDRVLIRIIKDPVTQMAAFKAGEIDFITSFSPEHVTTLRAQNPDAQIFTGPESTPMTAMMKVTNPAPGEKKLSQKRVPHPIFGDIRVRKAVGCYGTDREGIVKIAFQGEATPWVGMISPGAIDSVNVNDMCPYDPKKAMALLKEAGYDQDHPLTFRLMTNTEKSVFNIIGTVIKEQMAKIGVQVNLQLVDKVTWMATVLRDGDWDMSIEDLAALLTIDGNTYISASTATWNIARHTDTKVDEYYARYASEMDAVKRRAIAKALQEYVTDKMYWNTVSGSPFYIVAQPWVKGYVFNKEFEVHYETIWLEK